MPFSPNLSLHSNVIFRAFLVLLSIRWDFYLFCLFLQVISWTKQISRKRAKKDQNRRKGGKRGAGRGSRPARWHGHPVPRGMTVPPWHGVAVLPGTAVPPLSLPVSSRLVFYLIRFSWPCFGGSSTTFLV